jgi:hypothetical protein
MPNDVFGLNTVYDRQVESTWPESANYGYFAGGYSTSGSPSTKNEIYRIDYFDETVSLPGPSLTQARQILAGVSNSNYGYFAGGFTPPQVCTIDRIEFSSETVAVPPVGDQLTQAKHGLAGVSNSNYGYFAGGFLPTCAIDRIDFSSETVVGPPVHGASLTQARYYLTTVSSSNYGYFGGGEAVTIRCTIDRIDFSSETVAVPPVGNQLTQARRELAGVSNSNYGYFAGGSAPGSVCTIDRIDFSSETVAVPPVGNQLTQARNKSAGVSNLNYGYFGGGRTPPPSVVNTIDRIDFSSETTSSPGNNLLAVRSDLAGVSGGKSINARGVRKGTDKDGKGISSTYGYHIGGYPTPNVLNVLKRDYSTETISSANDLPRGRIDASCMHNRNYAYISGSTPIPGTVEQCTIDRLDFSNDTVADFGLMPERKAGGMTVMTSSYGYYCGGKLNNPFGTDPTFCVIDRLDFATEVTTSPTNLLTERFGVGHEVSTPFYGYFVGTDNTPGGLVSNCTVERLEFSTETVMSPTVTSPRGQIYSQLYGVSSFQDQNYGYFAGGNSPSTYMSEIDRLDFSNETFTQDNYLGQRRRYVSGNENNNYGYVSGGFTFVPPSIYVATVDRIEFSTKTVSTAPSLPTAYSIGGSVSN